MNAFFPGESAQSISSRANATFRTRRSSQPRSHSTSSPKGRVSFFARPEYRCNSFHGASV